MKKLLVPTDFSPNSLRAVDYAVQLARHSQAGICLVHTCNEILENAFAGQQAITNEYNESILNNARQQLSNLQNSIQDTEQLTVTTHIYEGAVRPGIQKAVRDLNADLVIMSTLGHAGLREWIFGSHTAGIISHSDVPVLAIPLEYEWSWPQKLLITIRDKEEASLLYPAFRLATAFGAEVQVALFTDEDERTAMGFMEDARELTVLEETLHRLYPAGHITTVHLSGHRFLDTLQEHIEKQSIDILAMITHPRTLVASLFNRSLTRQMAYQSKVPLLAIPI